jgi:hypothetical protein
MSEAVDYNARMKRLFDLDLSAEGLEAYAALPPARRKPEEVAQALRWAASVIEAQSGLIARMRVGLQPFAMAAPSWKGPDDTVLLDGRGFQIKLGAFRAANKLWHSRLS